jgi:hypothetical protein
VFSDSPKEHGSTTPTEDEEDVSGDEVCADDSANSSHAPINLPDASEVRRCEEDEIEGWYL